MFAGSEKHFGFLMADIARLCRAEFTARAVELSLTEGQWRVLAHLTRMEGCRQTDLAVVLDMRDISLTRHIDRLEANGLVERRPHPRDRRAIELHLTRAAQPIIRRMFELGDETREHALTGLAPAEREQLTSMLTRIRANLSQPADAATGTHDS